METDLGEGKLNFWIIRKNMIGGLPSYTYPSAEPVAYTNCIFVEGCKTPTITNECLGYDIKPSDGEASTLEI